MRTMTQFAFPLFRNIFSNIEELGNFVEYSVFMKRIFLLTIALSILAIGLACGGPGGISGDTPTEAYKRLYAAVKSKDTEAIKKTLTKSSIEFGAMAAQRQGSPVEKLYENGFTATTFSETLPMIRDERIKDNMASVEVWNSKDRIWEDLPFIKEDGSWKLAVGDLFGGTFKSPGRGRDSLEKEAANAMANIAAPADANANSSPSAISNAGPVAPTGDKNTR